MNTFYGIYTIKFAKAGYVWVLFVIKYIFLYAATR
jgi:hypothetical protein